jgi:hypothetical protein
MAMFGLFDSISGLALNALDVRASSEDESREQSSVLDARQSPERPLDVRFADFKIRLADAVATRQR